MGGRQVGGRDTLGLRTSANRDDELLQISIELGALCGLHGDSSVSYELLHPQPAYGINETKTGRFW